MSESRSKYASFFGRYVKLDINQIRAGGEQMVKCPFHSDSQPSMSVNLTTGQWKCHGCDAGSFKKSNGTVTDGGGYILEWLMAMFDVDSHRYGPQLLDPHKELGIDFDYFPIQRDEYLTYHEQLMNEPKYDKYLKWLQTSRRLSPQTIRKYNIGIAPYTHHTKEKPTLRYTIPIMHTYRDGDQIEACVNIRWYRPKTKNNNEDSSGRPIPKMINHSTRYTYEVDSGTRKYKKFTKIKGFGQARLYPLDDDFINADTVFLFEGEWDALLARQHGLQGAITSTGGAGNPIPPSTEHYFRDKDVYICLDNDMAGADGAVKAASRIFHVARSVRICTFPEQKMDFTDFIKSTTYKFPEDFTSMLEAAPEYDPTVQIKSTRTSADEEHVTELDSLAKAYDTSFYMDKTVSIPVRVSGKATNDYTVPKKFNYVCDQFNPEESRCQVCAFRHAINAIDAKGDIIEDTLSITAETPIDNNLLNFIDKHEDTMDMRIRETLGIVSKCPFPRLEPESHYTIERVDLSAHVDGAVTKLSTLSDESTQTYREAYNVFDVTGQPMDNNQSYKVTGLRTNDPNDQTNTLLITSFEPLETSLNSFSPTREELESLRAFQLDEGQSIKDKFKDLYQEFQDYHVVTIKQRLNTLIAYDLIMHSVLRFKFNEALKRKGWVEGLIIGDTRTGKSRMGIELMNHYGVGEFIDMGQANDRGLIGAFSQIGDSWFIRWGKIPLNDRKFLLLDELSDYKEQQGIAALSSVRSEGIAERTGVRTERTTARTRLAWVTNPKRGNLTNYYKGAGVWAILDVIKAPEDVARFDFAMGVLAGDVDSDVIYERNKPKPTTEMRHSRELCNLLVTWAWTRKANQVKFTDEATDLILEKAKEFSEFYSTQVPLIDRGTAADKLARLSVAVATRLFSADEETLSTVIVTKDHVEFIAEWLHEIYSDPALDYAGISKLEHARNDITDEIRKEIHNAFRMYPETFVTMKDFGPGFSRDDILTTTGELEDEADVREFIRISYKYNLITRSKQAGRYNLTPRFRHEYNQWQIQHLETLE